MLSRLVQFPYTKTHLLPSFWFLHLDCWMLVGYHKCSGITSVTNKYSVRSLVISAASVLVHHWRSSAVPRRPRRRSSCPNEAGDPRRKARPERKVKEWQAISRRGLSLFSYLLDIYSVLFGYLFIRLFPINSLSCATCSIMAVRKWFIWQKWF